MLTTSEHDFLAVLAFHFLRFGRADHAAALFDALAEIAPDEALHRVSAAYSHLADGAPLMALQAVDGLAMNGGGGLLPPATHWLRARALFSLGRVEAARAAAKQALALKAEAARDLSHRNRANGKT